MPLSQHVLFVETYLPVLPLQVDIFQLIIIHHVAVLRDYMKYRQYA